MKAPNKADLFSDFSIEITIFEGRHDFSDGELDYFKQNIVNLYTQYVYIENDNFYVSRTFIFLEYFLMVVCVLYIPKSFSNTNSQYLSEDYVSPNQMQHSSLIGIQVRQPLSDAKNERIKSVVLFELP